MSDNEDYFSNNDSDNESETSESELSFDNDDDNINNKRIDTDAKEDVDEDDDDDEDDENYELENDDELEDDEDEEDDDYDYENESQTGGADNDKEEELEKIVKKKKPQLIVEDEEEDDDDDEEEDMGESYLQKFNTEINKNYIEEYHPECIIHNHDEISALTKIIRDSDYNIIDPLHRTLPFLTKYEKTRIIGQRAKQINSGAKPFINVPENVIDGYLIAELELQQKRIPFIIRRPLNNGGSEYWNLKDLEIINF